MYGSITPPEWYRNVIFGGLGPWTTLHTVIIASSCGMFVYNLVTSQDTRIVSGGTLDLFIKLMKSVVSLRYDFCCCAIGWSSLSTRFDSFSVGPLQPEMIGFPTRVGLVDLCEGIKNWDSWRVASLGEPFFSHVVNEFIFVQLCHKLINSLQCFYCHWFF